jgi:hypothetical protein
MKKIVYRVRTNTLIRQEDVQKVGSFVFEKLQGLETPQMLSVIKEHKNSAIAKYIEWDDKKASENYRLVQVRNIVRSIYVEVRTVGIKQEKTFARCLVNITPTGNHETRTWQPIEVVLADEGMKQQVIERALGELRNWIERYTVYDGVLSEIIKAIKPYLS